MDSIYTAIGQPEINIETFWDVYLDLLKRLRDESNEELTDILTSHQPSVQPDPENVDLLSNMAPFRLGRPLDVGGNTNYIGGLNVSTLPSSVPVPHPEYADFTSDEESSDSGSSDSG